MRLTKKKKAILIMLGVVLLYILAEGPAYRLLCKEAIPQRMFTAVYYPVIWNCEHSRFIDDAFHSYEGLWYDETKEFFKVLNADLAKEGIYPVTNNPSQKP